MTILYEDAQMIVCEKPAGIESQSARGFAQDMVSMLMQHLRENGEEPYIGVIHRLDKVVGGILVYAKTKEAAAKLSAQMRENKIKKSYYAVICREPEKKEDRLEDVLIKEAGSNLSRVARPGEKGGKKAILDYHVRCSNESGVLLEVQLLTGRHHQIRVQLASRGMALAGDRKYGTDFEKNRAPMPALYAYRLEFYHPVTGEKCIFQKEPEGEPWNKFI